MKTINKRLFQQIQFNEWQHHCIVKLIGIHNVQKTHNITGNKIPRVIKFTTNTKATIPDKQYGKSS